MRRAGSRGISRASFLRSGSRIGAVAAASFVVGGLYAWAMDFPDPAMWHRGALSGALMAVLILSFHYFYVHGPYGGWMHRLPFSVSAPLLGGAYLVIILAVLIAMALLYEAGDRALFPGGAWFARHMPLRDVGTAASLTLVFLLVSTINSLIGPGRLGALVAGRYYRPRREELVAVIADLKGSTALAEALGDERFYRLLRAYMLDVTQVFIEHGGEIDSFSGDAILALWPAAKADRVLPAIRAARARLAVAADDYKRRYGAVPSFRVGVHSGRALVGEIGAEKRQIVAIGDFVNVTARIEGECRRLERDVLVSADFLDRARANDGVRATPLGEVKVRGRRRPVAICAVED